LLNTRAERSTDRQSDIIVQATLALVRRGDSVACSPDLEGARAGAALALSTVVLGTLGRANGARFFVVIFKLIDKKPLVSPRALDMVEMNTPKSEHKLFGRAMIV
jgi:hypothetical protein